MPRLRFLLLALALPLAAIAHAESLRFTEKHVRFDTTYQYQTVRHDFVLTNDGERPVKLLRAEPRSGRGSVSGVPATLSPGGSATLTVELPLESTLGEAAFRFAVFTDEPDVERYRFSLSGFVQAAFDPEVNLLDFGDVRRGDTPSRELTLASREAQDWKLTGIVSKPSFIKAVIRDNHVLATVTPDAPSGFVIGEIVLSTSMPNQPRVAISLRGYVTGKLVTSTRALSLGTVTIGSVGKAGFSVRAPSIKGLQNQLTATVVAPWITRIRACVPVAADCAVVDVVGTPVQGGPFSGEVVLGINGEADQALPVRFFGVALKPGQVVRDAMLASSDVDQTESIASAVAKMTAVPSKQVPTNAMAVEATPSASTAGPAATSSAPAAGANAAASNRQAEGAGPVRLHWVAVDEAKLFGYVVYRSASRAGPFLRVSKDVIPVLTTVGEHRYEFVDNDVKAGETWHYYVDSLSRTGQKQRLSPVLQKKVLASPK